MNIIDAALQYIEMDNILDKIANETSEEALIRAVDTFLEIDLERKLEDAVNMGNLTLSFNIINLTADLDETEVFNLAHEVLNDNSDDTNIILDVIEELGFDPYEFLLELISEEEKEKFETDVEKFKAQEVLS